MQQEGVPQENQFSELETLRQRVAELEKSNDAEEQADPSSSIGEGPASRDMEYNPPFSGTWGIIASTLDIDEVYETFAEHLRSLLEFDRIAINVIDEAAGSFVFKYVSGEVQAGRRARDVVPLDGTQTQHVLTTGKSLRRSDVAAEERFRGDGNFLNSGMRSILMVPLMSKGQVIGTLSLRSKLANAYGAEEQALLERLAHQVGPAVHNAELYEQTKKAEDSLRKSQQEERRLAEESALLTQIGRIISSTLEIDEVYERFAQEVKKLVDFDRMSLNTLEQDAGVFYIKYLVGQHVPERYMGAVRPIAGGQTELMLLRGGTVVQEDLKGSGNAVTNPDFLEEGLRSCILVPLWSKGRIIGAMSLRSHQVGAYGPQEQSILERLADQIAPAVENAELYAQTRKQEEALRESEERFRYLVESAVDGFFVFDREGKLSDVNRQGCELLGYTREELLDLSVEDIRGDETPPTWSELLEKLVPGVTLTVERLYKRKDGSLFSVENHIGLIEIRGENCLYSIARDISERKRTEEELLQQSRELAVLDERNRLARELHDSVTQSLYSLTLFSETARQLANAGNQERLAPYLRRIGETSQQALKEMRLLVHELRPMEIEDQGLEGALQQRLESVEKRAGINAQLQLNGTVQLPASLEYELYRVAQEALNNSLKHSAATSVMVLVTAGDQGILLEIEDNGRGFDTEAVGTSGGMGLTTMRERVENLGGRFNVNSQPGAGTKVRIEVPTPEH